MPRRIFKQRVAIAQKPRAAARRHADIGVDLMQSGQRGVAG